MALGLFEGVGVHRVYGASKVYRSSLFSRRGGGCCSGLGGLLGCRALCSFKSLQGLEPSGAGIEVSLSAQPI